MENSTSNISEEFRKGSCLKKTALIHFEWVLFIYLINEPLPKLILKN